jgi:hypothetical protein
LSRSNGLIKKHLALGQKTQAMAVLKRRKTREQHYSQRSAMRDNVLQIIMETHGCETHQQVCRQAQASSLHFALCVHAVCVSL